MKQHEKDPHSACYKHVQNNATHKIDYAKVKVIDTADTETKLSVKELLHILKKGPELNKQWNKQNEFELKTLIIKAHPQIRQEKT